MGKKYETTIKNIYDKSMKELRKDAHDKVYYQYVVKEKLRKKREAEHIILHKAGRPRKYKTDEERKEAYNRQRKEYFERQRKKHQEEMEAHKVIHTKVCEMKVFQ